jgi:AraC family transcriptional regulator of adaptative response / DNA-3-methyladenine glycosylase II
MRALATRGATVLEAAERAGFESPSAFHENFRELVGMTPAAYREIAAPGFTITLPRGFRPEAVMGLFGRDPHGRTERIDGGGFRKALRLAGRPVVLGIRFERSGARITLDGRQPRAAWFEAHEVALRCLGLESDAAGFERRSSRSAEIARLVRGQRGLRIPRSPNAFEGLVWVVVGAQVNVSFAATCRAALIELAGTPIGDDFLAHPDPAAVAALEHADLTRRQFSRRKAEYLIDAARAIVAGELDLEGLARECATVARERLAKVRGLGPWSVEYLMLRSLGFEDCAPIGDVALAKALATFFGLPERPDGPRATALMETFAPHRSLATYHLWRTLS